MNTALFTARVHGREQPCTRSTAVFTVRTRLCTRAVNTPVYRVHSRTQPCTGHGRTMYMARARSCTQFVYGPGHVPCTWPCLWAHVYGRPRPCTDYTAVHGPCTWQSMTRTRPCLRPCTRSIMACTDRVHHDTMHTRHRKSKVDNRNLLDGYYSNAIIRSLEIDLFTFLVAVTFWVTM